MANERDDEMADVIREFLTESRDNLDQFEKTLLETEKDPGSRTHLASLFRSVHSIKGSCGFLEFAKLEGVLHAGETLLGRVRDGRLALDAEVVSTLLRLVDVIRGLLSAIDAAGTDRDAEVGAVVAELERVAARATAASVSGAPPSAITDLAWPNEGESVRSAEYGSGKIRVDVSLLDRLMNLVGELVLARNQVMQVSAAQAATGAAGPVQRLSLVTTELQETVMKTRMQPIGNVWSRLPRIVRDLARASGKHVRLDMDGRDTELDKSIIEAILDPLIHVVRNAVDHGIETAERRKDARKPPEGVVRLRAFHEGGMVNIEISDDGAGIDLEHVKRRAVQQGLVPPERIARMSDREATGLLFLPGFSTAEKLTTVSGRGVGMDVVRTNVEKIGGTVDVHTELGHGSTVRIKIPLTLAIIPALIVTSGGARYAIPQASLLEVVRLEGDQGARSIELIQGAPVFRLRNKLLPIAYLSRELGVSGVATHGESVAVVILQADDRTFGLVVDDIRDTEEIVVKPLWKRLKGLACYAGATVMGDGRVALILDSIGLGQRVGVIAEARQRAAVQREAAAPEKAQDEELILLCRLGTEGRLAIPLSKVARLEEFAASRIEHVGGAQVAQYRGEILPLVHARHVLQERRRKPRAADGAASEVASDTVQIVVFSHEDRQVGLVVDGILDILSVRMALQRRTTRTGVLGSMVVQDKITEFLDVERALRSTDQMAPESPDLATGGA